MHRYVRVAFAASLEDVEEGVTKLCAQILAERK
jgi:hypothetical protein